jgi:hypothetical protein
MESAVRSGRAAARALDDVLQQRLVRDDATRSGVVSEPDPEMVHAV